MTSASTRGTAARWRMEARSRTGVRAPVGARAGGRPGAAALELHDDVVQGLVTLAYAAERGDLAAVRSTATRVLAAYRAATIELHGGGLGARAPLPGELRRRVAAGGAGAQDAARTPAPRDGS